MAITGPIPLPETGMDAFLKQLQLGEENRYKQGTLDIAKQAESREGQLQPLRLDELKAKIEEQKIINQNKDAYLKSQIESNLALSNQRKTGASGLGTGGKEELFFQNLVAKDNPQFNNDPAKIYEASNVIRQGGHSLADGTPINPLSPASQASFDRIIKSGNTSQGLNQQRFASTTESLIQRADENAEGAMKYSDLLGGAEGATEKISGLLGGEQSPDYQKYINFTRTDIPFIAGELMRELGVNASDEQKRMYKEVVDPVSWDTNPTLAMAKWNHFKEMVRDVGKSVSKSPSQTQLELNGGTKEAPIKRENSGAERLEKNLKLPKFNSSKEFNDWLARQPDIVKKAVSLKLKHEKEMRLKRGGKK